MNDVTIAVIGDIHGHFNDADVAYFNESSYDLLLFVGDLPPAFETKATYEMAQRLARLQKPALFIPGNHDATTYLQLLAEFSGSRLLARLTGWRHPRRHRRLVQALGPVLTAGYSVHEYTAHALPFAVVAARPYAAGGSQLNYAPFLQRHFGVDSLDASAGRLKEQVDRAGADRLIFLAHNGPTGLGDVATSIWGRDFGPGRGDWGDRDLEIAVDYARSRGKEVLAVLAGHMHLETKQGVERVWRVQRHGIYYVNCARVPRIFDTDGPNRRHHVRLTLSDESAAVDEIIV